MNKISRKYESGGFLLDVNVNESEGNFHTLLRFLTDARD